MRKKRIRKIKKEGEEYSAIYNFFWLIFFIFGFFACSPSEKVNWYYSKFLGKPVLIKNEYHSNGNLKSVVSVEVVSEDSVSLHGMKGEYDSLGQPSVLANYAKNRKIGSQQKYSHGIISEYTFYHPGGRAVYRVFYDSAGRVKDEKGKVDGFSMIDSRKGKLGDSYLVGDTLDLFIFISSPPNKIYDIDVFLRFNDLDWSEINYRKPYSNSQLYLVNPGKNQLETMSILHYQNGAIDTVYYNSFISVISY